MDSNLNRRCFTVPTPPSVNALFTARTIRGRSGRGITGRYKAWRDEAGYQLNLQRLKPLHGAVVVEIVFPDRGNGDIDNLAKAILDLAVKHEVIDGDSRKTVRTLLLSWGAVEQATVTITGVAA